MSRPANPYDNASCESFIKTLKREEIYANDYSTLEQLREQVEEFIERYYNQQRLHSALGYCTPHEFEQKSGNAGVAALHSPPDPIPARRINQMTVAEIQRSNLSHARMSHVKGSKPKTLRV